MPCAYFYVRVASPPHTWFWPMPTRVVVTQGRVAASRVLHVSLSGACRCHSGCAHLLLRRAMGRRLHASRRRRRHGARHRRCGVRSCGRPAHSPFGMVCHFVESWQAQDQPIYRGSRHGEQRVKARVGLSCSHRFSAVRNGVCMCASRFVSREAVSSQVVRVPAEGDPAHPPPRCQQLCSAAGPDVSGQRRRRLECRPRRGTRLQSRGLDMRRHGDRERASPVNAATCRSWC